MPRFARTVGIALLMLLIGWQLGVRYEQRTSNKVHIGGPGIFAPTGSGQVLRNPEQDADMTLFWHVWQQLNEHYVDPEKLRSTPLLNGAIEGLVRGVGDPYTLFMTPKENTEFREALAGHLEGIGAELDERDGLIVIVSPIKGSPAERAGLLPEDIIIKVDGDSAEGWTLQQAVGRIRGPKGTTVTLDVIRGDTPAPVTLSIVRDDIKVPSVESTMIAHEKGPFAHVALNQFGQESIADLRRALEEARTKNAKGLILDLRFNGGGYLEGAVDLASLFLRQGRVVTVEHRHGDAQHYDVSGRPMLPDVPLVLLQNEGSASAAEIVSGALQDHGRATVIGKKSFGKGTVQEIIDVPGGGSLRVTVARWLTPKGKDLGKEGVHPDIEVERTPEDFEAKRDPQLDAAVEWLATGKVTVKNSASSGSSR